MGPGNWLRLTDYASKYRISISTLRRRIKSGEIAHRFEEGKYLIFDESEGDNGLIQKPMRDAAPRNSFAHSSSVTAPLIEEAQEKLNQLRSAPSPAPEEPILSSANRLLSELKRAYMNILQEKEEQMIQLKEEVSDLKTLVRVLEHDNDRMRKNSDYSQN